MNYPSHLRTVSGLFVGRCTLDIVVEGSLPEAGTKADFPPRWRGAGGPAANAAATFCLLGGRAVLLTCLGAGPLAAAARAELEGCGVEVLDLAPPSQETTLSLCWGHPDGGRTVASAAGPEPVAGGDPAPPAPVLDMSVDTLVYDKEMPGLVTQLLQAFPLATTVYDPGRPTDEGRRLLPLSRHVVAPDHPFYWGEEAARLCSEADLFAISRGAEPIAVRSRHGAHPAAIELAVPKVDAVDTTGAGDVLHGAYAFFLARGREPVEALGEAAAVAAASTTTWGPRAGLQAHGSGGQERPVPGRRRPSS